MIALGEFAVSAFISGSPAPCDTQYFVIVLFDTGSLRLRPDRDLNHRGPEKLSFKIISSLKLAKDGLVFGILGLDPLYSLMQVGVEFLPGGFDGFESELPEGVRHALVDQFDAFGVIAVGGVHLQGSLEIVQDGQHVAHRFHGGEL